ncbi:MAG: deoxyuridine 5'-triphosphate nucleotidohydrolase [Ignisphaera sp.]|uniref:Deoxyuridine 5'-triphosphate nucleotidohydrolase n=1 Tax=Ignisphaera aggregans TaxID=334771 RepID=A0A7J3MZQ7_9CREN
MPNLVVLSPETLISVLGLLKENIDCSGMKLHLDEVFSFVDRGGLYSNSKKLSNVYEIKPNEEGIYVLAPGGYRIRYREIVKVPENTIAIAIPRSTLLRIGATIHTAVWDPGYEGRGEGLLVVFNNHGIEIEHGAQIAQLVFISLDRITRYIYRGSYFRENIT